MDNISANRWFAFFLQGTLFLLLFEMASGYSFYLLEISLVFLIFSFSYVFFLAFRCKISMFIRLLDTRLWAGMFAVLILLFYIIYDVVSTIYAPDILLVILKYKVILVMGLISLCIVYYCRGTREIDRVLLNISYVSFFTSLFTVLNYMYFKIYPIYYTLRLTLRRDYNMFATTIFIGFITGFFYIINSSRTTINKLLLLLIMFAVELPVIMLCGSRRIYILLFPAILLMSILFVIKEIQLTGNKAKTIFLMILWGVCISFITYANTLSMNMYMLSVYEVEGSEGSMGIISETETTPADRYETVSNGSLFDKRSIIWGIAIDEIKTFTTKELLIGKGNAYDILLYDAVENSDLEEAYPNLEARKGKLSAHNFLLADILNGGIIKLILSILLVISQIAILIKILLLNPFIGIQYSMIQGLVFINNFISNRYGFLYDKFFYIFFCLSILELTIMKSRASQRRE